MASDVAVNILLQAKDLTGGAFDSVSTKMGKLEKASGLTRAAFGALAGGAGTALVGALSDVANAAAEDEASVLRLKQAVENSGASWEANSGIINDRIKAGQNLAFTDDQVRDSLALLTAQTGDVNEALKRQKLAFDFARGAGIDLHTASKLLGKVTDENINVFARYGIHVEKGGDATAAFAAIQAKFGGQAQVYGDSTAGSIFKIRDAISEWREGLGTAMGPAMGFIALLPGLSSGMTIAGAAVGGLSTLMKTTMIPSFLATIPATIAMMAPFAPLILIIGGIALAVGLLALAWSNNWGDIQGKTAAVMEFLTGVFGAFGDFFGALWNGIVSVVQAAISNILGPIQGLISTVQNALGWLQQLGGAQAANAASAVAYDQANPYTGPQQPGFASGIAYVPHDMVANIHQGERIIPAERNRSGDWGGPTVIINGDVVGLSKTELADELGKVFTQQRRMQGLTS